MDLCGDKKLTAGIKNNEACSFEFLFEKYHRQLFVLALRYVKDEQLAEDAIQDLFLKVWQKRDQLDSSRSIKGFLFTTLKNHVLNMVRNRKRRILNTIEAGTRKPACVRNTEHEILWNEYQHLLEQGLEQLPSGKREVFRLRRVHGFTNQEVAAKLQISAATVKSQLYKATQFLRGFLKTHADL